jgi:hypothetical protein
MQFDIGAHRISADVIDRSSELSPHTGHALVTLRVQFTMVGEQESDQVLDELQREVTIEGDDGKEYDLALRSHSVTPGSALTTFEVELREHERLEPTAAIVRDIRLTPSKFKESTNDGALVIELSADVPTEQVEQIEALFDEPRRYLPVVREGVSDDVKSMRFGKCVWQALPAGRRHAIVLVEQSYDEAGSDRLGLRTLVEPEMRRMQEAIVTLPGPDRPAACEDVSSAVGC